MRMTMSMHESVAPGVLLLTLFLLLFRTYVVRERSGLRISLQQLQAIQPIVVPKFDIRERN
jgi:hypothetical protein